MLQLQISVAMTAGVKSSYCGSLFGVAGDRPVVERISLQSHFLTDGRTAKLNSD